MINLKNIQVTRGATQIFNDYNLTFISPGLNVIEGKNGSGKTTLIKMIAGFLKPNKGEITNKPNFTSHEWTQSHIYISSKNSLSNELSVMENIKTWVGIRGWVTSENEVEDNMKKIGIFAHKDFFISQCSEGIKRKTDLCKLFFSFKNKIKFWLLDEPTNNLDKEGRKKLEELLNKFISKKGTIIMSSHDNKIFKIKHKLIKLI